MTKFACVQSYSNKDYCNLSELLGKTLLSVKYYNEEQEVHFIDNEGTTYVLYHDQDCCEYVYLQDIEGDFRDLVGSPILLSEEVSEDRPPLDEHEGSYTWTFYKFATVKGYVDLRWYGSSNGYYSESVSFVKYKDKIYTDYDPKQQGDSDDDI